MKRVRPLKRWTGAAAFVFAAIAAISLAAIASGATTVIKGDLIVKVDGGFSPHALSKTQLAPSTLSVDGSIATNDGTHVPVLKSVDLQFDKNGTIYTKGLPTCKYNRLTNTLTNVAKKACGDALVGQGRVGAEVQFPASRPIPATGSLLVFNGVPQGGKSVLLLHAYINNPISATVITKAVITKTSGKYGTKTSITLPPLVSGQGSLISFTAKIGKSWSYKGQKKNLILAKCPTGNLFAHGDFTFANGTQLHGDVVRSCKGKG